MYSLIGPGQTKLKVVFAISSQVKSKTSERFLSPYYMGIEGRGGLEDPTLKYFNWSNADQQSLWVVFISNHGHCGIWDTFSRTPSDRVGNAKNSALKDDF